MSFTHLHAHSTFSFLDGYGTPTQIVERLTSIGHTACAVTDHGNVFAHVPFQKACREAHIKPIFGCEFYIVDDMTARTRTQETIGASAFPHVTILAQTQQGYEHLLKLSRLSWEEGFYYKPRIDWTTLFRWQQGLIVLSGCPGGYPARLIEGKGPEAAFAFMQDVRQHIENYIVEIVPEPGLPISHLTSPILWQVACELKLPVVFTADAHFPKPDDHAAEDLLLTVGLGKRLDDPARELKLPSYQYYCTQSELAQRALEVIPNLNQAQLARALDSTQVIADACNVEIPRAQTVVFPGTPPGLTPERYLKYLVYEGLKTRDFDETLLNIYTERAYHEVSVMEQKGFCDYILAINDVVRWIKEQGSLVMLRGSAGGSLMLWLIGASEIDPIKHGLSFERFYDENRPDPPDVDIDFERGWRDAAIEYIFTRYGRANCSQVAALSQLKAKQALQDIAFAYGIPRAAFGPLSAALDSHDDDVDKQLAEITDPQALAVLNRFPQFRIMDKLIGQVRQSSIHAAGVLISSQPLDKTIGVVLSQDKKPVAAVDKRGAADLGFLKMDFLAVNGLDIVATACRKADISMDDLYALPLDDREALRVAQSGMLAGVFQLDGAAAFRVGRVIGLDTFDDLVAASALCRPGPGDWVDTYVKHKYNPEAFATYLKSMHPIAADVVEETYGILLYQEQVMRLARELAGFSWPEVHKLRKGAADKLGLNPNTGEAWRAEWSAKFLGGCAKQGVHPDEAQFWWQSIQTHGGYAFNKSHAVTYGVVGYWMLWLKAHYPAAFYEAYLQLDNDDLTVKRLIKEFTVRGGQVQLFNPVVSQANFSSCEDILIGGYENLKGIGPKVAAKLMAAGPYGSWDDLLAQCTPALAEKLNLTRGDDVQAIITLAPWYPVKQTGASEAALRDRYHLMQLNGLPLGTMLEETSVVCGYVTATVFKPGKVIFVLEDEHHAITVRLSARTVEELAPKFKLLEVSDYIAVTGWWTGDVLFARDYTLLQRRAVATPKRGKKGAKTTEA